MMETIFDYELTDLERNVFGWKIIAKSFYIESTTAFERLSDLHLLFLIRGDRPSRERIINKLKTLYTDNYFIPEKSWRENAHY
jgi:hypothetical protein